MVLRAFSTFATIFMPPILAYTLLTLSHQRSVHLMADEILVSMTPEGNRAVYERLDKHLAGFHDA